MPYGTQGEAGECAQLDGGVRHRRNPGRGLSRRAVRTGYDRMIMQSDVLGACRGDNVAGSRLAQLNGGVVAAGKGRLCAASCSLAAHQSEH